LFFALSNLFIYPTVLFALSLVVLFFSNRSDAEGEMRREREREGKKLLLLIRFNDFLRFKRNPRQKSSLISRKSLKYAEIHGEVLLQLISTTTLLLMLQFA
jgi:hypothetical protein